MPSLTLGDCTLAGELAGHGNRPAAIICARSSADVEVGQVHPARRPRRLQVRGPLDDRERPGRTRQTGIVSCLTGHAAPPLGVALPADPALGHRGREQRLFPVGTDGADPMSSRQRGRPGRRPDLRERDPGVLDLGSGAHSVRSAIDRSASSSQSETSACSHSRSSGDDAAPAGPGRSAWAYPHHRIGREPADRAAAAADARRGRPYCLVTSPPWFLTGRPHAGESRTVPSRTAARRRRRRTGARRADDVHAVRRARLPCLRRRGQGRPADADPRRQARADGRLRRRGDRPPDQDARLRGADGRPWA